MYCYLFIHVHLCAEDFHASKPSTPLLRGRDSLIKEKHYLRAAALLALFSVLCQNREREREHTVFLHTCSLCGPCSFNGVIVNHMRELQWCFTAPSFQRWAEVLPPVIFKTCSVCTKTCITPRTIIFKCSLKEYVCFDVDHKVDT